jgi:hypothetical protein
MEFIPTPNFSGCTEAELDTAAFNDFVSGLFSKGRHFHETPGSSAGCRCNSCGSKNTFERIRFRRGT